MHYLSSDTHLKISHILGLVDRFTKGEINITSDLLLQESVNKSSKQGFD